MNKPYTVLLMLPDYWRSDQPSAADEITRIWVTASDPDSAVHEAFGKLPETFPAEPNINPNDFATVAVYPGHQFDEYVS